LRLKCQFFVVFAETTLAVEDSVIMLGLRGAFVPTAAALCK